MLFWATISFTTGPCAAACVPASAGPASVAAATADAKLAAAARRSPRPGLFMTFPPEATFPAHTGTHDRSISRANRPYYPEVPPHDPDVAHAGEVCTPDKRDSQARDAARCQYPAGESAGRAGG